MLRVLAQQPRGDHVGVTWAGVGGEQDLGVIQPHRARLRVL